MSILTLFPEMFPGPLGHSLAGKALENKQWSLDCVDIRTFSHLKHHKIDDKPFGGGKGLLMRPDIIHHALETTYKNHGDPHIIYTSPRGTVFNQNMARQLTKDPGKGLMILCGRYEGIDDRVIEHWREKKNLTEVSLGDFVLSGGELAAMIMIDACLRLLTINAETLEQESFDELELLEHSQYTRPREWNKYCVPEVLLSGDHEKISRWKLESSKAVTKNRRPDLWEKYVRNNE